MNVNCKDYQHQITLLLYNELDERTRGELELHLRECGVCKDAFESERAMHSVLAEDTPSWDVPSDLLLESRKALADALDRMENKRSWWRMPAFSVVFTPMRLLESADGAARDFLCRSETLFLLPFRIAVRSKPRSALTRSNNLPGTC